MKTTPVLCRSNNDSKISDGNGRKYGQTALKPNPFVASFISTTTVRTVETQTVSRPVLPPLWSNKGHGVLAENLQNFKLKRATERGEKPQSAPQSPVASELDEILLIRRAKSEGYLNRDENASSGKSAGVAEDSSPKLVTKPVYAEIKRTNKPIAASSAEEIVPPVPQKTPESKIIDDASPQGLADDEGAVDDSEDDYCSIKGFRMDRSGGDVEEEKFEKETTASERDYISDLDKMGHEGESEVERMNRAVDWPKGSAMQLERLNKNGEKVPTSSFDDVADNMYEPIMDNNAGNISPAQVKPSSIQELKYIKSNLVEDTNNVNIKPKSKEFKNGLKQKIANFFTRRKHQSNESSNIQNGAKNDKISLYQRVLNCFKRPKPYSDLATGK